MEHKGYRIQGDGTFGYCAIMALKQGQVPLALRGVYTSPALAKKHIDTYEEAKGVKHGKSVGRQTKQVSSPKDSGGSK